jgi:phosphoglycolate phosphatase
LGGRAFSVPSRKESGWLVEAVKLILFDVDGTLLLTGGAGSRAMTRAFEEVFLVQNAFEGIAMAGRTDPLIVADAFGRARLHPAADQISRFREQYRAYLLEELKVPNPQKRMMPGVRPLLDALRGRQDVVLGLLTGNYSDTARVKVGHFGLWEFFLIGAFGEDAGDRNRLVPVAVDRARTAGVPPIRARDVLVVGDTPLDVECALTAEARPIGVATGGFGAEALRESGAEAVFDDLSNADEFLRLLD